MSNEILNARNLLKPPHKRLVEYLLCKNVYNVYVFMFLSYNWNTILIQKWGGHNFKSMGVRGSINIETTLFCLYILCNCIFCLRKKLSSYVILLLLAASCIEEKVKYVLWRFLIFTGWELFNVNKVFWLPLRARSLQAPTLCGQFYSSKTCL